MNDKCVHEWTDEELLEFYAKSNFEVGCRRFDKDNLELMHRVKQEILCRMKSGQYIHNGL